MSDITTSATGADEAEHSGLSRRTVFRAGGIAGGLAALAALTGESLTADAATADNILQEPTGGITSPANIFVVAQTAEQLATTFYRHGVLNAKKLGLEADEVTYLKAAGIEEQLHQRLFASLTGTATLPTKVFSFPFGADTFTNLELFITTQQILEGVFDSAFIAAVRELARAGAYRAAQISAQIATVEAEHRVLGRNIAAYHGIKSLANPLAALLTSDKLGADKTKMVGTSPADNIGYTPVYVSKVSEALTLAVAAGFASPKKGNTYPYVSYDLNNALWKSTASKVIYKQPFIQLQPLPSAASMADRMSALRSDALHRAGDAMLAGKGDAYVSHHKGVDSAL
jgi:hypothetical protein